MTKLQGDKQKKVACQFCEEPIKEKDLGGMFKLKDKVVFFHNFPQCLLALKIQLQMDDNTVEEVAFHVDLCERCGSNHKTKDCIKTTSTHLTTWNCIYCEKDGYDLTEEQIKKHLETHKTTMNSPKDYLTDREKIDGELIWKTCRDLEGNKDELIKYILALLTSEVEKERERLLKEVDEKVIGKDEDIDELFEKGKHELFVDWDKTEISMIKRNKLRAEQRKALSDIGGKDES